MRNRPNTYLFNRASHFYGQRGFTVLEMLLACAILGIGVAMLSGALADSITRTSQARDEAAAVRLAESLLARLGADIPVRPGQISGQSGDLGWLMQIQPFRKEQPGREPEVQLVNVLLTLHWNNGRPRSARTWMTLRRTTNAQPLQ